ncbi:MAG TPA: tail fiber domain-containing protein, partial [Chthoniobacterales bacterium]|nr:tail fiber domain-containing protein [Chthoniobacterales bacterium]
FGNHFRLGSLADTAPISPGWGKALIFSGAPDVSPVYGNDNSDPQWLARFNVAENESELRVVIGDDSAASDKFVIGTMTGANFSQGNPFTPLFSVDGTGAVNGTSFAGSGSGLTSLNADNITTGTLTAARIANLDASKVTSGTFSDARLSSNVAFLNSSPAFTSQVTTGSGLRLNDANIWLRSGTDVNHGLGWFGAMKPFGAFEPDGAILFGYSGGGLGVTNGGNQTVLSWNNLGRIGIGTTNPQNTLDVRGSIDVRGFPPNDTTAETVGIYLRERGPGGSVVSWAALTAAVGGGVGVTPNGYELWEYNGSVLGPRFRILPSSGGSAAPTLTLDGSGNLSTAGTFSGNGSGLTNLNASNLSSGTIDDARLSGSIARLNSSANFTGSLGVGSSGPGARLHIKQSAINSNDDPNGAGLRLEYNSNTSYWELFTGSDSTLRFFNNIGFFSVASIHPTTGAYQTHSDRALKKDIAPLRAGLHELMALRPATYRFLPEGEDAPPSYGFIAQEVEEVLPELVTESDGHKSLSYDSFIPVAVKAIQELNEELERENAAKDARIQSLEERVAELERLIRASQPRP